MMDIDNDGGKLVYDELTTELGTLDPDKVQLIDEEWSDDRYGNKNIKIYSPIELNILIVGYMRSIELSLLTGYKIFWSTKGFSHIIKFITRYIFEGLQVRVSFRGMDYYRDTRKMYGGAGIAINIRKSLLRAHEMHKVEDKHKLRGRLYLEFYILPSPTAKANEYEFSAAFWAGFDFDEEMWEDERSKDDIEFDGPFCITIFDNHGKVSFYKQYGKDYKMKFLNNYYWDEVDTYKDPVKYLDENKLRKTPGGEPDKFTLRPGHELLLQAPGHHIIPFTEGYWSDTILVADNDPFAEDNETVDFNDMD